MAYPDRTISSYLQSALAGVALWRRLWCEGGVGMQGTQEKEARFVDVATLCEALGLKRDLIYRHCLPAGMPSVQVGRRRVFNIERCVDWLEAQGDNPPKP